MISFSCSLQMWEMKNVIFSLNLFDIDTFVSLLSLEKSRSYRSLSAIEVESDLCYKKTYYVSSRLLRIIVDRL